MPFYIIIYFLNYLKLIILTVWNIYVVSPSSTNSAYFLSASASKSKKFPSLSNNIFVGVFSSSEIWFGINTSIWGFWIHVVLGVIPYLLLLNYCYHCK